MASPCRTLQCVSLHIIILEDYQINLSSPARMTNREWVHTPVYPPPTHGRGAPQTMPRDAYTVELTREEGEPMQCARKCQQPPLPKWQQPGQQLSESKPVSSCYTGNGSRTPPSASDAFCSLFKSVRGLNVGSGKQARKKTADQGNLLQPTA